MSIETEVNEIVNKLHTVNFISKLQSLDSKEQTSKFVAQIKIKNISKFSKLPDQIKSDLDIKIPMDVEIKILCDGQNRDGNIPMSELITSVDKWSGVDIIPFHNMNDMSEITTTNISDECGSTDDPRIEEENGKKWIVTTARIKIGRAHV